MASLPPLQHISQVALVTRDALKGYPEEELKRRFLERGAEVISRTESASLGDVSELSGQAQLHPDVVIALGGDGTVLKALVAYPKAPTLAVNFGRVGFLTQCDREGLLPSVDRLLNQEYWIEERLALEVRWGERRARCINELVIKGVAHMCELSLSIDGHEVKRMRGDGLIIGTPTGSTAYLMSTGAPLVTPGVSCLIANPLNEYNFGSRPIILPGDAHVEVRVEACRESDVVAVIDGGQRYPLKVGDSFTLYRSEDPTLLVNFDRQSFFKNLRERMRWG